MQTKLLLVQRDYIKTTMKILCTKITTIVRLVDARKFKYYISHEKINRCLTDINRCLTDIFKI